METPDRFKWTLGSCTRLPPSPDACNFPTEKNPFFAPGAPACTTAPRPLSRQHKSSVTPSRMCLQTLQRKKQKCMRRKHKRSISFFFLLFSTWISLLLLNLLQGKAICTLIVPSLFRGSEWCFLCSQSECFHISCIPYIPSQVLPGAGQVKRPQETHAHWLPN